MIDNNNTQKPSLAPQAEPQETIQPDLSPLLQEKKSKSGFAIILLILLFASLGITGFFIYQNYLLKQQIPPKTKFALPSPSPALIPSPTYSIVPSLIPTVNITANWLTYSNENVAFTFKYPKEISLKEEDVIHLSLWGPTQKKDTEFYDGISLTFSFPFKIENTSLKDYVDSKIEESKQISEIIKPREEITINEINGYTYTEQGLGIFQSIYLQSPGIVWTVEIINGTNDPTGQGFKQTVDKILSTFKFIQ